MFNLKASHSLNQKYSQKSKTVIPENQSLKKRQSNLKQVIKKSVQPTLAQEKTSQSNLKIWQILNRSHKSQNQSTNKPHSKNQSSNSECSFVKPKNQSVNRNNLRLNLKFRQSDRKKNILKEKWRKQSAKRPYTRNQPSISEEGFVWSKNHPVNLKNSQSIVRNSQHMYKHQMTKLKEIYHLTISQ